MKSNAPTEEDHVIQASSEVTPAVLRMPIIIKLALLRSAALAGAADHVLTNWGGLY